MAEDTSVEIVQHPQEAEVQPVAEQEQSAPQEVETASAEGESSQEEAKPESKTFTQEDLDKILLREKRAVERKVRRELEAVKPQAVPEKVDIGKAPNPDDYADYTEYTKAAAKYAAREEFESLQRQAAEKETQRIQNESNQKQTERIQDVITKGESKYDDFHVKVPEARISKHAMDAILECNNAEDITYYLATNEEEADRLLALSPAAQAKEIGKLEDKLSAPKTVKSSNAPTPPSLVKSGSTPTSNINEMTDEQYYEYRKKTGARWAQHR